MTATPTDATHTVTLSSAMAETQVFEISDAGSYALSVFTDLNAMIAASEGGTITARLYNKVDEANYREVHKQSFIVGTDTTHPACEAKMIHHNVKLTIQCTSGLTASRAIPYRYITEDLDA